MPERNGQRWKDYCAQPRLAKQFLVRLEWQGCWQGRAAVPCQLSPDPSPSILALLQSVDCAAEICAVLKHRSPAPAG